MTSGFEPRADEMGFSMNAGDLERIEVMVDMLEMVLAQSHHTKFNGEVFAQVMRPAVRAVRDELAEIARVTNGIDQWAENPLTA